MHKDLYPTVFQFSDWFTLQECRLVNKKLNKIADNEIKKRLLSKYPLGDINAKLNVFCNDIFIDSIFILLNGRKIRITEKQYHFSFVRNVLLLWFGFSFAKQKFITSTKIYKAIIKMINKSGKIVDENFLSLVFTYTEECIMLEDIM